MEPETVTETLARGLRGLLIFEADRVVFRVWGEIDPATGRKSFRDYQLRVEDLPVEITSDYYRLVEDGPTRTLDYRGTQFRPETPDARSSPA